MPEAVNLRLLMIASVAGALVAKWWDVVWNFQTEGIDPVFVFLGKLGAFFGGVFFLCAFSVMAVDKTLEWFSR